MTLPSSGPLSMSAINAEFGRGNNLNAYRGTTWYTDAGGSGTFSSGALSFSDFYGKRATSPTFSFTISSSQTNANLRTLAINAGWNQSSALVATISSGVYISSNSTGTPSLTVSGSFPGGVSLTNNGYIVGMGGAGGRGYDATVSNGSAGGGGGTALSVSASITITNNGTIAGGGGGGGGGQGWYIGGKANFGMGGGGGGGGRSSAAANSSGGGGGSNYGGYIASVAGGSGTVSSQGSGGAGGRSSNNVYRGGDGGSGGGWGSSGSSGGVGAGSGGATLRGPAGGGSGGNAVSGNGYVSWVSTGTRLGGIS
jgi:hypothetical protein